MITKHKDGFLVSQGAADSEDLVDEGDLYELYYRTENDDIEICDYIKRRIYNRGNQTMYYLTWGGELYKYTDQSTKLLQGCDDFAVSPDGSVVLYASGGSMWVKKHNGVKELVEATDGRKLYPLSISNDAKLAVWAAKETDGYILSVYGKHGPTPEYHTVCAAELPLVATCNTGGEIVFFVRLWDYHWNGKRANWADNYVFSFVPGQGLRDIRDFYDFKWISGYDTMQCGGSCVVFDSASLAGIYFHYFYSDEQGYEDDNGSIGIFQKDGSLFGAVSGLHARPIFFYNRRKKYVVGTDTGGRIMYFARLENGLPMQGWYIKWGDYLREIKILDREKPVVVMTEGIKNGRRLICYSVTALIDVLNNLVEKHEFQLDRLGQKQPFFKIKDLREELQASSPTKEIALDYEIGAIFRYEKNQYIAYTTFREDTARPGEYRDDTLVLQSLCGKPTLTYKLLAGFGTWLENGSFFFSIADHNWDDGKWDNIPEEHTWFFDAARWKAQPAYGEEFAYRQLMEQAHDWREPETLGRSIDVKDLPFFH